MVRGTGISFKLTIVVEYTPDIFTILLGKFKQKRGGGRHFRSVPFSFSINAKALSDNLAGIYNSMRMALR